MRKGYKKTGKTEQVSKQENRTAKKRTERERRDKSKYEINCRER